ncbi:MAG: hypothetical protein EOP49_37225, partial [Sphingobacteriales bacterium]
MMQILRNRNIANTDWNIADTFLYPVLFFGSTSFFIHKLGAAQFGIWMLINTIVVSMKLFNLGVGSTVFRNIAFYQAQRNDDGCKQVMNNAFSITFLLFCISLLVSLSLAVWSKNFGFLNISQADRNLFSKGIIAGGIIVGFKFLELVFTNYFKALEQFNKAMIISSGNKLAALLINIGLLLFVRINVVQLLFVSAAINAVFFVVAALL